MINHKHKCIFIHIPRTAGTSIELLKLGMPFLHVIPFKREKIGMKTTIFDDKDNDAMRDEGFTLRSKMTGGYRNITRKNKWYI